MFLKASINPHFIHELIKANDVTQKWGQFDTLCTTCALIKSGQSSVYLSFQGCETTFFCLFSALITTNIRPWHLKALNEQNECVLEMLWKGMPGLLISKVSVFQAFIQALVLVCKMNKPVLKPRITEIKH